MSEQQFQSEPKSHDGPHQDDPLDELARIVSGEEIAPVLGEPKVTPVAANQQSTGAPVEVPPPPNDIVVETSAQADIQQEVSQAGSSSERATVHTDVSEPEMDLESQLLAELGGVEDGIPAAQEMPAPAATQFAPTATLETDAALNAAPQSSAELDFAAELEQQLFADETPEVIEVEEPTPLNIEDAVVPDLAPEMIPQEAFQESEAQLVSDEVIGVEDTTATNELPAETVVSDAKVDTSLKFAVPEAENGEVEFEIDDTEFESAFAGELEDVSSQNVEATINTGPEFETEIEPVSSDTPASLVAQPEDLALMQEISHSEQLIEQSSQELQSAVEVDAQFEDDFSDAFADQFSDEIGAIGEQGDEVAADPLDSTIDADVIAPENTSIENSPVAAAASAHTMAQETLHRDGNPEQLTPDYPLSDPMDQSVQQEQILASPPHNTGFRMASIALGLAVLAGCGLVGYNYFYPGETTGEPALITADNRDFKVKPEEPGGKTIPNQDQPVYDLIEGNKSTTDGQEKLVSNNENPIEVQPARSNTRSFKSAERLPTSDEAPAKNTAITVMQPRKVKTVTVRADGSIVTSSGERVVGLAPMTANPGEINPPNLDTVSINTSAANNSVDGAITTGRIAVPSLNPTTTEESSALAISTPVDIKPATDEPIVVATRSLATPVDRLVPVPVETTPIIVAPTSVKVQPVNTASLNEPANTSAPAPSGAFAVQISSQRSHEAAEASYQNLTRRFPSMLKAKPKEIREAKVDGKGTFYRVRLPMNTRGEATSFCSKYKSAGGSCFVTR